MSDRDELAGLVNRADWTARAETITDAILAAGYRKPRTVTTPEELDALPAGSVVLGGGVVPRIKADYGQWIGAGIDVDSTHIIGWVNDATVLYEPEQS